MDGIIACPGCQRKLRLREDCAGKLVQCPACLIQFSVPLSDLRALPDPSVPGGALPRESVTPEEERGGPPERLVWQQPRRRLSWPGEEPEDSSLESRGGKGGRLVLGLVIAGLVITLTLGGWVAVQKNRRPKAVREEAEQRRRQVMKPFHQQPPLDDEEIAEDVKPFFESLGAAIRARGGVSIIEHFDLRRLADELIALDILPADLRVGVGRSHFAQRLWVGMTQAMQREPPLLEWTDVDVHGVQKLSDDEAILIVRHHSKEGTFLKMRWWLTRRGGSWKVYDLEDLTVGLRMTTVAASLAEIKDDVDCFCALVQVWVGRDDRAVPLFKTALAGQQDAEQRRACVRVFLGMMAKAGKAVQAYDAAPDPAEAFRILAAEVKKSYRLDEMRQLVLAHRRKVPRDPLLPFYQAEVHVWDGNYQLADKAFQVGLASPPDAATLAGFRASRVLARFHTGKMLSAYTDIGPRQETFRQLALLCLGEDDLSQLQTLLDAHAKVSPKDSEAVWFRCRLKARGKQVAEAIDLLHQALAEQPEEEQTERVQTFLSDMLAAGKMLEGYRAAPDARKAFRHLADELQEEGRSQELKRLVDAHQQRHPDDPWGAYYQGQILLEKKAWDQAVQVLSEAWKKATKEDRQVFRWSYLTALYRAGRAVQAYAEVEPEKDTFNQLANLLIADAIWKELEDLITARRAHAAEDPDLLFNEARARVGMKRSAEAIPFLLKAYQRQPADPQKSSYVSTFVLDMERQGLGLEGYRAAPDKVSAFRSLASKLLTDKKDKELEKLLQEHGRKHADDLWHSYYLGELHLLRDDPQKSEQQFTAALAKASPQERGMWRSALFRAKVKAGKAVDAYLQARAGTRPFEELAGLCLAQKDAGQLRALLAARRRADPDDPGLPVWELEVRWLRRDYEGALKLLAEHREGVFAQVRHRWKYQDCLVRALVRLNRPQEAVKEAEAFLKGKHANPVLLVLAYAAQGDVKRATAAAEQHRLGDFRLTECYQDVDLGPLLHRESFREFRKKFPEPKGAE